MQCFLCGAENPDTAKRCGLCDVAFAADEKEKHVILESVDIARTTHVGRKIGVGIFVLALLFLPWYLMSDLFVVPEDVRMSRDHYEELKNSYLQDRAMWDQRKNQVLANMSRHRGDADIGKREIAFNDMPLEVFMAFLSDDLEFLEKRFAGVALCPVSDSEPTRFILSKYEKGVWLGKILVSLEVEIQTTSHGVSMEFRRLRRGLREVSQGLAWNYFAAELSSLRGMEVFVGGVRQFHLYSQEELSWHMSWRYLHRSMMSCF